MTELIDLIKIARASKNLNKVAIISPFEKINSYSHIYNSNVYFKREDLQKVKSFKIRGAYNKISNLNRLQASNGLVCASAGNHAQGFAVSCNLYGYNGMVFMPENTPNQKVEQVKRFGGKNIEIILVGENFGKAYEESIKECSRKNKIFIHPFDDIEVITGQATVFYEIIDQINFKLDYLFVPIGGGGLISGAINVFKQLSPNTKIIGVEPLGAPSMYKSLKQNTMVQLDKINRFVDGVAVEKVGKLSFSFCKDYLDDIILIDENEICDSILELKETENIIVEPAGAMSCVALRHYKSKIIKKQIGCIICGGNIDKNRMPEIRKRAKEWKNQ